jgi:hypothetical protein
LIFGFAENHPRRGATSAEGRGSLPFDLRSAFLPFALIWLAVHAALLALLLGVKFLGVKLAVLSLVLLGAVWFLARQPLRLMPPRHRAI